MHLEGLSIFEAGRDFLVGHFRYYTFYRLFEEKVGIGLPLMEEVNAESELSLRFEQWEVRKSRSEIFIYIYGYICAKFCDIHFDGEI